MILSFVNWNREMLNFTLIKIRRIPPFQLKLQMKLVDFIQDVSIELYATQENVRDTRKHQSALLFGWS